MKSAIISYTRKVRRVSKMFKELRSFVKWAGCSEGDNTRGPLVGLERARQEGERFHRERPGMPGGKDVE